jgi:hypothetical protein
MNDFPVISRDRMLKVAPAIFAQTPANHVSQEYKFVPTIGVIDIMEKNGFEVIGVKQQKVRNADRKESTKHKVNLRRSGFGIHAQALGGIYPIATLINSHDWSSNLEFDYGIGRQICGNLAIGFASQLGSFRCRHDSMVQDIASIIGKFSDYVSAMMNVADSWNSKQLSDSALLEFSKIAAEIRFGESATPDHAKALLIPRRDMDNANTLWTVYNRIQENATQGGVKQGGMSRTIRAVSNIAADKEVNVRLFETAKQFAE